MKNYLRREEWDFSGLMNAEEVEKWACYYYEYARTHNGLKESILSTRELDDQKRKAILDLNITFLRASHTLGTPQRMESLIPHLCPEFPTDSWQQIPSLMRRERLTLIPELSIFEPVMEYELGNVARDRDGDTFEAEEARLHPKKFAVIALDSNLSDAELHAVLDAYLKGRSKDATQKGRARTAIDGLRSLSALRLVRHHGSAYAVFQEVNYSRNIVYYNSAKLPYRDASALSVAARRAKTILASM